MCGTLECPIRQTMLMLVIQRDYMLNMLLYGISLGSIVVALSSWQRPYCTSVCPCYQLDNRNQMLDCPTIVFPFCRWWSLSTQPHSSGRSSSRGQRGRWAWLLSPGGKTVTRSLWRIWSSCPASDLRLPSGHFRRRLRDWWRTHHGRYWPTLCRGVRGSPCSSCMTRGM